jgi:hypothetical protein
MTAVNARTARAIAIACFIVGALFFAKALYRGLSFSRGDFYNSVPGEYARRWNPVLWNSPDVQPALEYSRGEYLYGPTQYLALFPIVFLDSYASIASARLVVYAVVLLAAWQTLWRLLRKDEPEHPVLAAAVFAVVFVFLPLAQTLIQREFEAVGFLLLVVACLAFARGRDAVSGSALAALTWFKYWPVVLLAALVFHRRLKALAAFLVASGILLGTAHVAFGLDHFRIGQTIGIVQGLLRPLGNGEKLYPVIDRGAQRSDFCRQWIWGRGTESDIRWALCGLEDRRPALSAKVIFFTLVIATGALFAWGAYRVEKWGVDSALGQWAAIWEFSILTIAGVAFVHAHYYYYIVFLLPLCALLYWYATRAQRWRKAKVTLWVATYVLVNALLVPLSWVSAVLKRDAMDFYLNSGLCMLGTLLLLGLVLWEFTTLSVGRPRVALSAA